MINFRMLKRAWDDFNNWVGTRISIFLSSMGGFWIILGLTVFPLFKNHPHGLIAWTMYIVQTIFQGAALPLLGYVSDRAARQVGVLIGEMHDVILGRIMQRIDEIDRKVTEEHAEMKSLLKEIHGNAKHKSGSR